MDKLRRVVVAAAMLISAGCSDQPRYVLPEGVHNLTGPPRCATCRIELVEIARLGHPQDRAAVRPDAMAIPCMVGALSGERWVVSGLVGGGELLLFDGGGPATGTLGRAGRGPGEFGRDLSVMVGPGDTLHVVDNSNYRVVTLTADGAVHHSFRISGRIHSMALLPSGRFLFHARPTGSPEDRRGLFTLVTPLGDSVVTFGQPSPELADLDQWTVGPASDGGFWTASGWRYRLHRWSSQEGVDLVIEREAEWFPPDQVWSDRMYVETPPPSWLTHIAETEDGLLWTYAIVPDAEWRPGPMLATTPEWTTRVLDTMIEVIDLVRLEVLAELRFDHLLAPVCGAPLVYTVDSDETGATQAVVFEPRLTGRSPY